MFASDTLPSGRSWSFWSLWHLCSFLRAQITGHNLQSRFSADSCLSPLSVASRGGPLRAGDLESETTIMSFYMAPHGPGSNGERVHLIRRNLKEDLAASDGMRPSNPAIWEALAVKRMLSTLPLPLELVEATMDFAEYWPCIYTEMKESVAVLSNDGVRIIDFYSMIFTYHHWVPEAVRDRELLRTGPLGFGYPASKTAWKAPWSKRGTRKPDSKPRGQPILSPLPTRGIRPCRKIVFSTVSRGECRGNAGAASWFDAALEKAVPGPGPIENRPDPALHSAGAKNAEPTTPPKAPSSIFNSLQSVWQYPITMAKGLVDRKKPLEGPVSNHLSWQCVSYNEPYSRLNKHRVISWRYDDDSEEQADNAIHDRHHSGADFVRSMDLGDSIILSARTRSPFAPSMTYIANASVCVCWAV